MKTNLKITKAAVVAAAILVTSACGSPDAEPESETATDAPANEVDVKTQMYLSTAEALQGAMEDTFSPEQVGILINVAHQKVVTESCDGFEIDNEKFASAVTTLVDSKKGEADFDANRLREQLLTGMGMATGAELAISAYDQQAYCDGAREDRNDAEATNPLNIYAEVESASE